MTCFLERQKLQIGVISRNYLLEAHNMRRSCLWFSAIFNSKILERCNFERENHVDNLKPSSILMLADFNIEYCLFVNASDLTPKDLNNFDP